MSAEDCVRAMAHIVDGTDEAINLYNLGTGDTCSVRRIAEIVVEESGLKGVLNRVYWWRPRLGWRCSKDKSRCGIFDLNRV